MTRPIPPLRLVAALALFAGAAATIAHHVIPASIERLASDADLVLRGTIQAKTCLKDNRGQLYTRAELKMAEVWKRGDNPVGESIEIVYPGGILGERRLVVSPGVDFRVGEEVVVFLRLTPSNDAIVVGLDQGKFTLARPAGGSQILAHNPNHGVPPNSLAKPDAPSKPPLTLAALKKKVLNAQP